MQATVRSYDETTHSGSVLLDDGTELPYDATAFAAGGLRLLRLGQRVRITLADDGLRVASLTIATLPDPTELR
jgi:hypothetical protein